MKWISIKKASPLNETYVKVKMHLLFETIKDTIYLNKYFISKGENITKWVTHWSFESVKPALLVPLRKVTKNEFQEMYMDINNELTSEEAALLAKLKQSKGLKYDRRRKY